MSNKPYPQLTERLAALPGIADGDLTALAQPLQGPINILDCGAFDPLRPALVAVLDLAAEQFLAQLPIDTATDILKYLSQHGCAAIIASADNLATDCSRLRQAVHSAGLWFGRCKLIPPEIINRLTNYGNLPPPRVLHGVLMDVFGIGILITGEPGLGKSELALELLSREHVLVADDAPIIARTERNTLEGRCSPVLQDLVEVRGLGILNAEKMFGGTATRSHKRVDLNLHLARATKTLMAELNRLEAEHGALEILGLSLPRLILPVAPGRNLAVLVEAAARNFRLMQQGYSALDEIEARQRLAHPEC